jgi:hypothetical protein
MQDDGETPQAGILSSGSKMNFEGAGSLVEDYDIGAKFENVNKKKIVEVEDALLYHFPLTIRLIPMCVFMCQL